MRGYGSWCLGWKDAERNPGPPPQRDGCGLFILVVVIGLVAFSTLKVAAETGSGFAIVLGICIILGMLRGAAQ
jgi:hypothetical protein